MLPSSNFPGFHARHLGSGIVLWADTHATTRKAGMREGAFGFGFNAEDFKRETLGDIDKDGDLTTDELFDLE